MTDEELIEAATWDLIEWDTDTSDRGVSDEHYRDRRADVERVLAVFREHTVSVGSSVTEAARAQAESRWWPRWNPPRDELGERDEKVRDAIRDAFVAGAEWLEHVRWWESLPQNCEDIALTGDDEGVPGFTEREKQAERAWEFFARGEREMSHDFRGGYHQGLIDGFRRGAPARIQHAWMPDTDPLVAFCGNPDAEAFTPASAEESNAVPLCALCHKRAMKHARDMGRRGAPAEPAVTDEQRKRAVNDMWKRYGASNGTHAWIEYQGDPHFIVNQVVAALEERGE